MELLSSSQVVVHTESFLFLDDGFTQVCRSVDDGGKYT
jgi:hypothetical protein